MTSELKESFLMFFVQVFSYTMVCINMRAVAQTDYAVACTSDAIIASAHFFIIKKLANSPNNIYQWIGFTSGSVVGSALGIYISTVIRGAV